MNNSYAIKSSMFLAFVLLIITSPFLAAAEKEVGKTVAVIGSVTVTHKGDPAETTLSVPNPVFLYDKIQSTVGSRAKFMLQDDSILKLGSLSKIELTELLVGENKQQTTIKQLSGQLRILLGKKLKPGSHFKIHSPVAVAGVRGTDFEVIVQSGGKTAIRCFEGEVAIANLDKAVKGEVSLVANHYTIVEKGVPPLDPIPIPAGQSLLGVIGAKKAKKKKDNSSAETEEFQEEDEAEGEHEVIESDEDKSGVNVSDNRSGKALAGVTPTTDPLDVAEARLVPVPDLSENSTAGRSVLGVLGIIPAAGGLSGSAPGSKTPTGNSTGSNVISDGTLDTAIEDALDGIQPGVLENGPDITIEEPKQNAASVSTQVTFPTP